MWIGSDDEDQSGEERSQLSQALSPGMRDFLEQMKMRRKNFEEDYKRDVNPFADDKEIDFAWKGYMAKQQDPPPLPPTARLAATLLSRTVVLKFAM